MQWKLTWSLFFFKWDHLMDTCSSHNIFLFVQNIFQKYIKVITIVEPMIRCVCHCYSLNSLNLIKRSVNEWCRIKREKLTSGAESQDRVHQNSTNQRYYVDELSFSKLALMIIYGD